MRHATRHVTRLVTTAVVGLALTAGIVYTAESDTFTPAQRSYWAFQPVKKSPVPAVKNQQWVKTPIDSFVLAKLEEAGLQPNPPADRLTLLRRATIDMTGLPPTQEEIQQFLADKSPNAWEKVVDRLLASPAYGERWARHWLDVARYADSNGFKADETRPNIWRYRDYVIDAFNSDKPYDRFIKEQIAGDELYPGDPDALVAMGFNRHWIDETNAAASVHPPPGNAGRHDHRHGRGLPGPHRSAARAATITSSIRFCRRTTIACRRSSPTPASATVRCR